MTAPAIERTYKPFVVEVPAPGECLRDCHQMWNSLTFADKLHLASIIGLEQVITIERLHQKYA